MRTIKSLVLVASLIAGIARAADLDTAKLDQLRSAVAEAAAIGEAQSHGLVTRVYANGVRADIRKSLQEELGAPGLGEFARQALRAVDANDQAALRALKQRLVAMERAHGRAG